MIDAGRAAPFVSRLVRLRFAAVLWDTLPTRQTGVRDVQHHLASASHEAQRRAPVP